MKSNDDIVRDLRNLSQAMIKTPVNARWHFFRNILMGVSQEELAAKIRCPVSVIQMIESGNYRPTRNLVGRLAFHLQCPYHSLAGVLLP